MKHVLLSMGLLSWMLMAALYCVAPATSSAQAVSPEQEAREKAIDKEHLQTIWKALMEYKKAKGQLPDYLSDLVPEFLPDKSVLVSPAFISGLLGRVDPRLPVSYSYEFRADKMGNTGRTFRELKEEQMQFYGEAVPVLRCFAHGDAMNIAYSGDYFESKGRYWEQSPGVRELMKKLDGGVGAGGAVPVSKGSHGANNE